MSCIMQGCGSLLSLTTGYKRYVPRGKPEGARCLMNKRMNSKALIPEAKVVVK